MATERAPMLAEDHAQTALDFLSASDREFDAGDRLQGSLKLWDAATHAMTAVAQHHGWPHDGHRALKEAAERLTDEHNDIRIAGGFGAAEKFHGNFYYDYMEDFELVSDRPKVHDFVRRVLALL